MKRMNHQVCNCGKQEFGMAAAEMQVILEA